MAAPSRLDERNEREIDALLTRRWPAAGRGPVVALAGDASTRRYARCTLRGEGAPASVVIMIMADAAVAMSSEELGIFGEEGPDELPFLNMHRYLAARTDAVPEVYARADDSRLLLLEDVGDTTLWKAAVSAKADAEGLFREALSLLADLQSRCTDDGSGCYAFLQAFDERLFAWEFEHFLEHGLLQVSERDVAACRAELAKVASQLAALPRVFSHRDYHAWNIHVDAGRLRLIDFQDALLAPALYDVASLLTDRCTPELVDTEMEARLLAAFHELQRAGRLGGIEQTTEAYRLCALQRALKVIGRFNYLADAKGKTAYLDMLPAVVRSAQRLVAQAAGMETTARLLAERVRSGSGDNGGAAS